MDFANKSLASHKLPNNILNLSPITKEIFVMPINVINDLIYFLY